MNAKQVKRKLKTVESIKKKTTRMHVKQEKVKCSVKNCNMLVAANRFATHKKNWHPVQDVEDGHLHCYECDHSKPKDEFASGVKCKLCHKLVKAKIAKRDVNDVVKARNEQWPDGKKPCSQCECWKEFEEFYTEKRALDGLTAHCKLCQGDKEKIRAKEYSSRTKDEIKKIQDEIYGIKGLKKCTQCKKHHLISEFYSNSCKFDGLHNQCIICHDENMQEKKDEFLERTDNLKSYGCQTCKFFGPPICFDMAHMEGSEKLRRSTGAMVQPSRLFGQGKEKMEAELKKIEISCRWCHRMQSHMQRISTVSSNNQIRRQVRYEMVNTEKLKRIWCVDCNRKVIGDPTKHDSQNALTSNFWGFDFDHMPDEIKVERISKMCTNNFKVSIIQAEMKKCRPRCCTCHAFITQARRVSKNTIESYLDDSNIDSLKLAMIILFH